MTDRHDIVDDESFYSTATGGAESPVRLPTTVTTISFAPPQSIPVSDNTAADKVPNVSVMTKDDNGQDDDQDLDDESSHSYICSFGGGGLSQYSPQAPPPAGAPPPPPPSPSPGARTSFTMQPFLFPIEQEEQEQDHPELHDRLIVQVLDEQNNPETSLPPNVPSTANMENTVQQQGEFSRPEYLREPTMGGHRKIFQIFSETTTPEQFPAQNTSHPHHPLAVDDTPVSASWQQTDSMTRMTREQDGGKNVRQSIESSSLQFHTIDLQKTHGTAATSSNYRDIGLEPPSTNAEESSTKSLISSSSSRGRQRQQQHQQQQQPSLKPSSSSGSFNRISTYRNAYQQNGDLGSRAFVVHYEDDHLGGAGNKGIRSFRGWMTTSFGNSSVSPNIGLSNSNDDALCGMAPHEMLKFLQITNALASVSSLLVASLSWLGKLVFLQLDKAVLLGYLAAFSLILLIVEIVAAATPEQQRLVPTNVMGRIRDQMGFLFHPWGKAFFVLLLSTMCWGIGGLFLSLIGVAYFISCIGWFYAAVVYPKELLRLMGSIDETYWAEAQRRNVSDPLPFSVTSWNALMTTTTTTKTTTTTNRSSKNSNTNNNNKGSSPPQLLSEVARQVWVGRFASFFKENRHGDDAAAGASNPTERSSLL